VRRYRSKFNFMKIISQAAIAIFCCVVIFTHSSCRKIASNAQEIETTFDLAGKEAMGESLTEDVNNILTSATDSLGLSGNREYGADNYLPTCAVVTVTGSFPQKRITINFGDSCRSINGIVRSGIIRIVLTDSVRRLGSTATVTFENYKVNGYKKEGGSIVWENISNSPGSKSWRRRVNNVKITAPSGNFWTINSDKTITQTMGLSTPRHDDDTYIVTGSGSVINAAGESRTSEIIEAIRKQVSCSWIDMGSVRHQSTNHTATVNFGNGNCDNIATISIDGNTPRTITLP
jgi:hypothetical protein